MKKNSARIHYYDSGAHGYVLCIYTNVTDLGLYQTSKAQLFRENKPLNR